MSLISYVSRFDEFHFFSFPQSGDRKYVENILFVAGIVQEELDAISSYGEEKHSSKELEDLEDSFISDLSVEFRKHLPENPDFQKKINEQLIILFEEKVSSVAALKEKYQAWTIHQLADVQIKKISQFFFKEDDFVRAGLGDRYKTHHAIIFNPVCYDYGFYHHNLEFLFETIFRDKEKTKYPPFIKLRRLFKQNGYKSVSSPEAGDLMLYFSGKSSRWAIDHVGIVLPENKIISKWGKTEVYEHCIGNVPNYYGDKYTFIRRNIKSIFLTQLDEVLGRRQEASAPREEMLRIAKEVYAAVKPTLLRQSLLGIPYNKFAKQELFVRLHAIPSEEFSKEKVIASLHEVNALPIPQHCLDCLYLS